MTTSNPIRFASKLENYVMNIFGEFKVSDITIGENNMMIIMDAQSEDGYSIQASTESNDSFKDAAGVIVYDETTEKVFKLMKKIEKALQKTVNFAFITNISIYATC